MTDVLDRQLDWSGFAEAGIAIVIVVASVLVYGHTIIRFTALIEKLALRRIEQDEDSEQGTT